MKFLKSLFKILHPRFLFMNDPYSAKWDAALNHLIDKGDFAVEGDHCYKLSGYRVWTSNYPYAYGSPHGWASSVRPRRATIIRLREALEGHAFDKITEATCSSTV